MRHLMKNSGPSSAVPIMIIASCLMLSACGDGQPAAGNRVESSGKEASALDAVPADVLRAGQSARPELAVDAAEREVRNGQEYWDIAGRMPDGSELELDITMVDGAWSVVEVQRDITVDQVPTDVREALTAARADWEPHRIIESDQGDGVIIYEFFGPGPGADDSKIEVKWEDKVAEALVDEWVH